MPTIADAMLTFTLFGVGTRSVGRCCCSNVRLVFVRPNKTAPPKQKPRLEPVRFIRQKSGIPLLILPITAFCLGTWQVKRHYWKTALIEELRKKTMSEPIPLPKDLSQLEELEYKPVSVRGEFDYTKEALIGPRSNIRDKESWTSMMQGSGSYIITPFKLADRDLTILVNRGWMPRGRVERKELREKGRVHGVIELTGVVRHNEKRQPFMPKAGDSHINGTFIYRNLDQLAEYLGTAPIYIDANAKSTVKGGPIGGQTRVTLRNEHFAYIMTWYMLALFGFGFCYHIITKGHVKSGFQLPKSRGFQVPPRKQ